MNVLPFCRRDAAQVAPRRPFVPPRSPSGTALETVQWDPAFWGAGREGALSVPAILACRNLIVGAAAQMHAYRYRGGERLEPGPLLTQPDPDTIWPATLGGT